MLSGDWTIPVCWLLLSVSNTVFGMYPDLTSQPHFIGLLAGCLFSVVHVGRYL